MDGNCCIAKLPLEIIVKIFSNLSNEEMCRLKDTCKKFQEGAGLVVAGGLSRLKGRLKRERESVERRMFASSVSSDSLRLDLAETLLLVRLLEAELALVHATVWRYAGDPASWAPLTAALGRVVGEFNGSLDVACRLERTQWGRLGLSRPGLDGWEAFLDEFEGLERSLPAAGGKGSFEAKILDALGSCPSANFQLAVGEGAGDSLACSAYFAAGGGCPAHPPSDWPRPAGGLEGDRLEEEARVLSFLRRAVQRENASFLQETASRIRELEIRIASGWPPLRSVASEVDELRGAYLGLLAPYPPLHRSTAAGSHRKSYYFYRNGSFNNSLSGLVCTLTTRSSSSPLLLSSIKKSNRDAFGAEIIDSDEAFHWDGRDEAIGKPTKEEASRASAPTLQKPSFVNLSIQYPDRRNRTVKLSTINCDLEGGKSITVYNKEFD